jgi:GR25 family glycosyltransferase involved in LPS biosynthesis
MPTLESIPKFCLTLPEKPHRTEAARNHLNDMGMLGVQFVNGINGQVSGLKTIHPYCVDDPSGNFSTGHHEAGIFLSHLMLWQHIALTHDYAIIAEDDCILRPTWKPRLEQALIDMPSDTDWLFLGSCGTKGNPSNRRVKGDIWDVRYPACNHLYLVSRRGARILCETQRKVWGPVDVTVYLKDPRGGSQTSFDKMKVFTLLPRIADQFNTEIPE